MIEHYTRLEFIYAGVECVWGGEGGREPRRRSRGRGRGQLSLSKIEIKIKIKNQARPAVFGVLAGDLET